MATVIVYHQVKKRIDCADGIAAAWVAQRKYPDAEILGCCYGDIPNRPAGTHWVIVDFSFPKPVLDAWISAGDTIELIDHHKTALQDLSTFKSNILMDYCLEVDLPRIKIDIDIKNHSGATLAWWYFNKCDPPAFLEYICDRDMWWWKLSYSEEINAAISHLRSRMQAPLEIFTLFDLLSNLSQLQLQDDLRELGHSLLYEERLKIDQIVERNRVQELFDGVESHHPLVVNVLPSEEPLISKICQRLYEGVGANASFVACITTQNVWSLRSNKNGNNFDVSVVAKRLGGGGHHNAAGFTMKECHNAN